MKYKAIISDFDGTLVNKRSELSPELIKAIHGYMAQGGHFCLATGRDFTGHIVQACQDLALAGPQIASAAGRKIFAFFTERPPFRSTVASCSTILWLRSSIRLEGLR